MLAKGETRHALALLDRAMVATNRMPDENCRPSETHRLVLCFDGPGATEPLAFTSYLLSGPAPDRRRLTGARRGALCRSP
ncbi:MAG: hypothetical protein JKP97_05665 [Rhodobacteraceae bacterium]|jgi:hypothetical protein|nr:hypothetical protein [Paracoccaceae bacterium]